MVAPYSKTAGGTTSAWAVVFLAFFFCWHGTAEYKLMLGWTAYCTRCVCLSCARHELCYRA